MHDRQHNSTNGETRAEARDPVGIDDQRPRTIVDGHSKPALVFFYSPTSGRSRRVEGFLAQVLQHRRNHDTFAVKRVDYEARPDLAARLGVESAPAIVVIEARRVRARLERPRGCTELQVALAPWLK